MAKGSLKGRGWAPVLLRRAEVYPHPQVFAELKIKRYTVEKYNAVALAATECGGGNEVMPPVCIHAGATRRTAMQTDQREAWRRGDPEGETPQRFDGSLRYPIKSL